MMDRKVKLKDISHKKQGKTKRMNRKKKRTENCINEKKSK